MPLFLMMCKDTGFQLILRTDVHLLHKTNVHPNPFILSMFETGITIICANSRNQREIIFKKKRLPEKNRKDAFSKSFASTPRVKTANHRQYCQGHSL